MAIDYDKLLALRIPDTESSYTRQDTILYALGIGLGADPTDERQLRYVYEKDLVTFPTMCLTIAQHGPWIRDLATGIDWRKIVFGEQSVKIHRALPSEGRIGSRMRIVDIIDKGEGRGALLLTERRVVDMNDGALLAETHQTIFCRGEGGFGGPSRVQPAPETLPGREPDMVFETPILPQAALIYRLTGDLNPLHAEPSFARLAGFDRPILHGLATLGHVAAGLLEHCFQYDAGLLGSLTARFSAPVYPGETVITECWSDEGGVSFRSMVPGRDALAISLGRSGQNPASNSCAAPWEKSAAHSS